MSAPVLWVKDGTRDLSVYGHTLINNGAIVGRHMEFDGSSNIFSPSSSALSLTVSATFMAWIKFGNPSQAGAQVVLAKKTVYNENQGYYFSKRANSGAIEVTGSGGTLGTGSGSAEMSGWHHIAGSINVNDVVIYENGVDVTASSTASALSAGSDILTIGCFNGLTGYFTGSLDDIRIYNEVKSADFINIEYLRTKKYY